MEENLKKIVLRAGEPISRDTVLSLKGTKAIRLECMSNTDEDYYKEGRTWTDLCMAAKGGEIKAIEVTTWSSLVRNAIDILKEPINHIIHSMGTFIFMEEFKANVEHICGATDIKLNSNCPKRLFKEAEETDLIKSSVYMNNKNHMIKIFDDEEGISWYLCAVYTGEIIIMLQALLETILGLLEMSATDKSKIYHTLFVLSYVNREDLDIDEGVDTTDVASIDAELNRLQLSKDLIALQMGISSVTKDLFYILTQLQEIQKEYNLSTVEDMLSDNK